MSRLLGRLALSTLLGLCACVGPRPSDLARGEEWLVVVNSVRIPKSEPWYSRFAEHTWIDIRRGSEDDWLRLEVSSPSSGVIQEKIDAETARARERWGNQVFVLETLRGEAARGAAARMLELAEEHPDFGRLEFEFGAQDTWTAIHTAPEREPYAAWPGPNSNTFVADLVAGTPGMAVELHHNAVGKDYARGVNAGRTLDGLGLEADSDYLGLGLGLRQGLEVRFLGLTLGAGLWPPALKLPLAPRLGVHQGWVGSL